MDLAEELVEDLDRNRQCYEEPTLPTREAGLAPRHPEDQTVDH